MKSTAIFVGKGFNSNTDKQIIQLDCLDPKANIFLDKQTLRCGKQRGPPLSRRNPRPSLLELLMSPPWCSLFEYR